MRRADRSQTTYRELLADCRVTDGAKVLLLSLLQRGGRASTSELLDGTDRSRASVSRWVRQLQEAGYVRIEYNGPYESVYVATCGPWKIEEVE